MKQRGQESNEEVNLKVRNERGQEVKWKLVSKVNSQSSVDKQVRNIYMEALWQADYEGHTNKETE